MGGEGVPLHEAVYVLEKYDPAALERLRNESPELAPDLRSGMLAGPAGSYVQARAKTVLTALDAAIGAIEDALPIAKKRIKFVDRWRFLAELATLIGGLGVVALLKAAQEEIYTMFSAGLAAVGSIASFTAGHGEKLYGSGTVYEVRQNLVDAHFKASSIADQLKLLLEYNADEDELGKLMNEGLKLCYDINQVTSQIIDRLRSRAGAGAK